MSEKSKRVAGLSPEQLQRVFDKLRGKVAPAEPRIEPRPRSGDIPLSFAQERLWFLEQLEPGTAAYHVPSLILLAGPLRLAVLQRSLTEVTRRHEALRTTFAVREGQPFQVIAPLAEPPAEVPLPLADLAALPAPQREAETLRLAQEQVRSPFDLERGPLLRALLVRRGPDEHAFFLTLHHAVADGWSGSVLIRELAALYEAFAAGRPSPLPALPVQYADYAIWQRAYLQGPRLESQLAYWRGRLAGVPVLQMATDRPHGTASASQGLQGATRPLALSPQAAERLRAVAQAEGATLFMGLLAGLAALLARWSGQDDFAIGSPIANRNRSEVEGLIGFFSNTVVLRADLRGEPGFRELLRRVRETAVGAYAHEDLPFEKLVGELQTGRDLSRNPLFQVMCSLHSQGSPASGMGDLRISPFRIAGTTAKFDLTVSWREDEHGVGGTVEYRTGLFDATTIARLVQQLERLIDAALDEPERPVHGLPILGDAERHQMLREWTAAPVAAPGLPWVHRRVEEIAARQPDAPAVEGLTYAELNRRANRLAHRLRRLGAGPEARVAVFLERSPELAVAVLGILKSGAAYLPVDPAHPAERIARFLGDAQWAVTRQGLAGSLPAAAGIAAILLDEEALEAENDGDPAIGSLVPDHPAYVIYTSGSTGAPKGVVVTHRSLARLVDWHRERFGIGPGESSAQTAGPTFDAAAWEIWAALAMGAWLRIPDEETRSDPQQLVSWIAAQGLTLAFLATPLAEAALAADWPPETRLRLLSTGGDRLHHSPRPGLPFGLVNAYGPTEATVVATAGGVEPAGEGAPPIGRPIAGVTAQVAGPHGEPVPLGVPGELRLGGSGLARGYLDDPGRTAERFVPDPLGGPGDRLYRTGDLVRWRTDGALDFLGRIDHQIKVRGVRAEPGEIEAALLRHPAVRAAAAVLAVSEGSSPLLVAHVVLDGTPEPPLAAFLRGILPDALVPAVFVPHRELPLTSNGKVDRRALAALPPGLEAPAHVPPRTLTEELLAGIWEELLGREGIGALDDFFALGGHSLLATRLLARVRSSFGVALPVRRLFEGSTLEGLAQAIEAARAAAEPAAEAGVAADELVPVPREPGEPLPLSFSQERLWFLDRLDPGSPTLNIPMPVGLAGTLDLPALAAALNETVRRHESLRTTFHTVAGEPRQRIAPAVSIGLPVADLSGLPEAARQTEAGRLAGGQGLRRFDLERGPLLDALLVRLAPESHRFLMVMHHIVSDGWSVGVLVREVAALYEAFVSNRPSPLTPLPVQYADYALWQRRALAGEGADRWDEELGYWLERLGGEISPLDLPTDRPRPAVQTFRGSRSRRRIAPPLAERLRAFGRDLGATPFMVLLAASATLLHRHSGQEDVLIGAPVAGRQRVETEGLIGLFLNTLVLRVDLAGDPSFRGLVARVREVTLGAYGHQDLPFEALLARLQGERDLSRTPLFQVMFNLLNFPSSEIRLPGLTLEVVWNPEVLSKFDMTFYVAESPDGGIGIDLVYNTDLFDAARMEDFLAQLEMLVAGGLERPDEPLGRLSLVTERARALLPDPAAPLDGSWIGAVHERFLEQARRDPGRLALSDRDGSWTYGELAAASGRLAGWLHGQGIVPGDRVAVFAHRSAPVVPAVLAILRAGGAFTMLDPAYPAARLVETLDLATPRAWLHLEAAGPVPEAVDAWLAAAGCPRLELPRGKASPSLGEEHDPPALGIALEIGPDDIAYVAFTSGSTGAPKGILGRHGPLSHFLPWQCERFGLTGEDRFSLLSGLAHDPLQRDIFTPLFLGGSIAVPDPEDLAIPGRLAAWMAREGVTVAHLTPAMGQLLTEPPAGGERLQVPSLRRVLLVGDALTRLDVARIRKLAPAVTCVNLYGSTETQRAVAFHEVAPGEEHEGSKQVLPLGRGMKDVQLLVLNRAGAIAGITGVGEVGEIAVRSPHLARGYLGDETLTADRFRANPFTHGRGGDRLYRTGDLGRYLPDGEVAFAGRADLQVKIRGFRIEPGEIEAALRALPGVREAVVLARGDGTQKSLAAYIVPEREGAVAVPALREALRDKLPAYMVPAGFALLERLPLTPNAKVDRKALARIEPEAGGARPDAFAPPSNDLERRIAEAWSEVLGVGVERVGAEDNFFDLGGHSLLLVRLHGRLQEILGREIPLIDLFSHPNVRSQAARLGSESRPAPDRAPAVRPAVPSWQGGSGKVAIVGMAGRFPQAADLDRFWANLRGGVDSITRFTAEELIAAGTDPELAASPRYLRSRGVLAGEDLFDAAFFDCSPLQAELMDPQLRLFLEASWEALEDAGYDSARFPGAIGVHAGVTLSTYFLHNLYSNPDLLRAVGGYQAAIGTDRDYLTTQVSYKLGLTGPSVNVQTACSTSLVAVHLACQSLLTGECDMALAGGVSIKVPQVSGGFYQEGGIDSLSGLCRPFDAAADGTVWGSGLGVVVLKRLEDALADGDAVRAVILGSAVNNDGSFKVGFTAPSVDAQARVVATAQARAGITPESVSYIEAHGTGTPLGDPIEAEALRRAFGPGAEGPCWIGSVKSNIGHLGAAAGVASLIKTVLALEHRQIPPSLHFERLNPAIDFAGGPFRIAGQLTDWPDGSGPRRAGISAFGLGGTNAHVILEEAPAAAREPRESQGRHSWHLLALSARSEAALDEAASRLSGWLAAHPEADLADVAWTLQTGRRAFPWRRALVCREGSQPAAVLTARLDTAGRRVAFLFPGQGAQHPDMGRGLYEGEPVFRRELDACAEILLPLLGRDLREVVYPAAAPATPREEAENELRQTRFAQPALFAVEYALARLWMSWGVKPWAMIGHSVGEYVAACLAGVFSLEDALALVAARGELMQGLPEGAMLSVELPEAELRELLAGEPEISLAAVNAPSLCAVSGSAAAIAAFEARLGERGAGTRRLHTSHAFHSALVEPALAPFAERVAQVELRPPSLPYLSNVTGTWITPDEATDPGYWVRHLRGTVRFADGVAALLAAAGDEPPVLLETGPGRALGSLARQGSRKLAAVAAVASMRHPKDSVADAAVLLGALGRLWLAGVAEDAGGIDWAAVHSGARRRVPLPAYPFQRRRFWVEPGRRAEALLHPTAAQQEASQEVLAAPRHSRPDLPGAYVAPANELEEQIAGLFGRLLGIAEVGARDDFFELGGHSLLGTQLLSRIRDELGVELPLDSLFDAPTVAGLAVRLEAARGESPRSAGLVPPVVPVPRMPGAPLPLSFSQERLWFLDRLEPGSAAYNIPMAIHLHGPLDAEALERAVGEVIRRHEALRTSFPEVDGGPVQRISPPEPFALARLDLPRDEAVRQAAEEARRPFDLANGPLVRAVLMRMKPGMQHPELPPQPGSLGMRPQEDGLLPVSVELMPQSVDLRPVSVDALPASSPLRPVGVDSQQIDGDHLLLVTIHHIVADGWSLGVLIRELGTIYRAFTAGDPSPLPELPVQYADYAQWQRAWLTGAALDAELAFWRERLGNEPPVLELPGDRPRPALETFRGARLPVAVPAALTAALTSLGHGSGATLYMTLLAAYAALLGRYTGQDDLAVGSPVAGRGRAETEGLIGLFINTLVLRADLSGDPAFLELLPRVRETALAAFAHQDLPFEKLVEELRPERRLGASPLFQVLLILQNVPAADAADIDGTGLTLSPIDVYHGAARFDLTLALTETPAGLAGYLEYKTDLLDAATAERWAGHLATLLAGIAEGPARRLSELPLLPEAERRQLLVDWNATAAPVPEAGIHHLFAAQAERTPEAVALVFEGEELTYRDLRSRAGLLARQLREVGVGPEVLVGVALERSPEMLVAVLGVLAAGGAYLPLDPVYPAERLGFMLQDSGAAVLLTQEKTAAMLPDHGATVLYLEGAPLPALAEFESWEGSPDHLAYVLYTSGSTGKPKGVQISHRALTNFLLSMAREPGLAPDDVLLAVTSLSFDIAALELYLPLLTGARLEMVSGEAAADGHRLLERLAGSGATVVQATPSTWRMLLDAGWEAPHLRLALAGGEALLGDLSARLRARTDELWNVYGPTETAIWSTLLRVEEEADTTVPIGRPLANTTVYVLDRFGNPLPAGMPGELQIGGAGVARGYLGRPALTAERFVPDAFGTVGGRLYRTGDLVRRRADGILDFIGRIDHQVKVRGHRIELGEIEAALGLHPAVSQAAVLAADSRLVAYVVVSEGEAFDPGALRDALRSALPEYMVPSVFVALDALPLTPNRKVDRRALARIEPATPAETGGAAAVGATPPRNPVEEVLAAIWADVLGREPIGIDDDFFALGGHSLLATRAASRIRRVLGVAPEVRWFFERPTVRGMAERIEAARQEALPSGPAPAIALASGEDGIPLSFAQQRLWFLDRLAPGGAGYNLSAALRLEGSLDVPALARGLETAVGRHGALRTAFPEVQGEPVQWIEPPQAAVRIAALPVADLAGLAPDRREAELALRLAAEMGRPFDLSRGPLLRTILFRLGEREHVLSKTVHHIVADAWSLSLFVRELSSLYSAFAAGEAPAGSALPELPIQYADFAVWQRGWLTGEALERRVAAWRELLDGIPAAVDLPADRPYPPVQSYRGGRVMFRIGEAETAGLRALGRAEGTTLFMTLLAAFQALLHRYSGQQDVVVGSPIAGRNREEVEALIGVFINTLALRAGFSGEPSFRDLLGRVRETALAAYALQDLPFEKLVEELQPVRDLARPPIFQTLLALENVPPASFELPGVTLTPIPVLGGTAKYELALWLAEEGKEISGALEYASDLFDPTTAKRILGHFRTLLAGAVAAPGGLVADLPLLPEDERRQLLFDWNQTAVEHAGPACFHRLFEAQAERMPEDPAVHAGGRTLTYGELERRANRLARHLRRLGVAPGVTVGVALERSLDLPVALLAVMKAGGAYLPLDPSYPAERLALMIEDSGAPLVVTQESLRSGLPAHGGKVVSLDADAPAIDRESAAMIAGVTWEVNGHDLAYVLYTSGSTGRPKGVQVPHAALVNFLRSMRERPGLGPRDVLAAVTSLSFDIAGLEIYLPLLAGAQVVLAGREEAQDGGRLAALLERVGATVMQGTPATWRLLLEAGWTGRPALKALVGGEALPASLAGELAGRTASLWNLYGPTETTVWSTVDEVRPGAALSIGRPIDNTEIFVVDGRGEPVPAGVRGELWIGGAGLARGYLGRPGLTAERFVPHPFAASGRGGDRLYRTGDLARYRQDGNLEILGRLDQQVKVHGFRIEPGEIEAALCRHPGVTQAAVVAAGARAERGGSRLAAYVVLEGGDLPASALRTFLVRSLPAYMVPASLEVLPALPLTPNGKVDRKALVTRTEEAASAGFGTAYEAPRNDVEEALAAIWREVLGVERVGIDDDFFDLGGHSLLATRAASRIRQTLGVAPEVRWFFESPTVRGLGEKIERMAADRPAAEEMAEPLPPIAPVPREDDLPLSFAQQRLWFLDRLEPGGKGYNLSTTLRLTGALDVPALARGLETIVRRHEALRTAFPEVQGQPVQWIEPPQAAARIAALPVADLAGLAPDRREAELAQRLAVEIARPFDLSRGPLLRAALFRLGEREHALAATVHHIVADAWSVGLFVRELSVLYAAIAAGAATAAGAAGRGEDVLPELPIQYADFTVWQRAWLAGEALERRVEAWRERLAGIPAGVDLPADRPYPPVQSYRGASVPFRIGEAESAALRALGRAEGTTLFMTLLAAFQALLHRYSGQQDVVVGSPIAGRNREEVEALIGVFINTLALRASFSGEPSFRRLLGRVRETALAAYALQDLPFEKLVEELQPARDLARPPVFQTLLALQNVPPAAFELPGVTLAPIPVPSGTAKYELALWLVEDGKEIAGSLEYAADLFDPATAERILGHFRTLLAGAVAAPGRLVADLPLLTADERRQLLLDWNQTAVEHAGPACFHRLFEAQAERIPEDVAVQAGGRTLTYRELELHANRLARHLRRLGVARGVTVGVALERSLDLPVALLAVMKAGGAYVPLDPSYPAERLALMLEDSGAPVIVTQESLRPGLPPHGAWVVSIDADAPAIGRESAVAAGGPSWDVSGDDLAYVLYTSGSTGKPKGVQVPHAALVNFLRSMREQPGLGPRDVLVAVTSLSFDIAGLEIYLPLLAGAKVVLASREEAQDGGRLAALLARSGATVLQGTPATWRLLLEAGWKGDPGLKALVGGEALPASLAEELVRRTAALWNLYGPTETTIWSTVDEVRPGALPSIGRPIANTGVYVVDGRGMPAPVGVPGELRIGGAGVARGYLGRPDLTAERFVPHPFATPGREGERLYRTGDLARFGPDGRLEFLGRLDHQVKVHGFRIEPGEIEAALCRHPGVAQATVVAQVEKDGSHLAAYVVPKAGAGDIPPAELRAFLSRSLPAYMVPPSVEVLPALPLTPNGKVDRKALLARTGQPGDAASPALEAAYEAPRNEAEEALAAIWREVLGVERVGIHDDFFALGGHSILATRLMFRLRGAFGVDLPLRTLFEAPTVAALAKALAGSPGDIHDAAAEWPRIEPDAARRSEPFPLTDVQEAYWIGRSGALELGSVSTHVYFEVEATGMDLGRLETALRRLIDRHGMLRAIVLPDGLQQILPEVPPYGIAMTDLRGAQEPETAAGLLAIRGRMSHQVLPSDRWPLFEIAASRFGADRLRVHVSLDLLIGDAWSFRILGRELARLYEDPSAELPPLDLSFRDYVLAELALRDSEPYRRALDYWRARISTLPPAPALPLAADPSRLAAPRFARRSGRLEPTVWARLKERAARATVTPSGVLLAAYAEVLGAWSASPRFTINLTLFNRLPLHPQVDDVVGDFTSLTLLAVEQCPDETFETRARHLQARLWDDLDHRLVSGVRVLRELRERTRAEGGAAPIMPVVFTSTLNQSQDPGREAEETSGDEKEPGYGITQTPQVWLDHQVFERGGALTWSWDAVEELFPAGMLDDLFAAYGRLLDRLASPEPEAAWTDPVRSLLPAEQLQLVASANATAAPVPTGLLHEPFLEQARRRPEADAVVTSQRRITYGELDRASLALAHRLRRLGARPNQLIAVVMEKGWEQVVAVFAILRAGAAYMPVDARLPAERIRGLLEQGEAEIALTQPAFRGLDGPAGLETLVVDPALFDAPVEGSLAAVQSPTDLAYVIFTSGSTGQPKGVMIDHRGALNTCVDINTRFGAGSRDRVLALSSLSFDLSVYDVFGLLAAGGAVVIPDAGAGRDPGHWADLASRERVTIWNSVPALMEMLIEYAAGRAGIVPATLRLVMLSGDWVPVRLPDRIRGAVPSAEVVSLGGATEASIWSILYPIAEVGEGWTSIPYGKAMVNQAFFVLDEELKPCPVWVPGHLYIGGIGLAQGYWRDEAKTNAAFLVHPRTGERLYRTGDLGRLLPSGDIEFLGRDDTQVKVQGHRIELGEIETVLSRHPSVSAAVVDAIGERQGAKQLVGYVILREPETSESAGNGSMPQASQTLLDPVERLRFKLRHPGLRREEERPAVELKRPELAAEGVESLYLQRRSYRKFLREPIPLDDLASWLACLSPIDVPGSPFPKYRYGSAGNLYPVQLYVCAKPERIENLAGGTYYYDPAGHRLVKLSEVKGFDATLYDPANRAIFEEAGFGVFLVARLDAITPLYGERGRHFAALEAGLMTQLLETAAPEHGIGLSQVGGVRFEAIRGLFDLEESHALMHSLLGGRLAEGQAGLAAFQAEAGEYHALVKMVEPDGPGVPAQAPPSTPVRGDRSEREIFAAFAALREHLRGKLPEYMVPAHFVRIAEIPLSANGKVDRKALPRPEALRSAAPGAPVTETPAAPVYTAPQTELERVLTGIVGQVLGLPRVGVHDNFFDLGATSVHVVRVHNALRQALGREIPMVEMFNHPSVALLARHLGGGEAVSADAAGADAAGNAGNADRTDRLREGKDWRKERLRKRQQAGGGQ